MDLKELLKPSDKPEADIAALKTLFGFLLKRTKEVTARAEALRCLCELHGVFDHAEYEKWYADALAEWDRAMSAALTEANQVAIGAALDRLLQSHEGTKQ